jgi:transcriptional regulator of arginine metabolism
MREPERDLGKHERQRLIASLIARKRVGTQHELMAALEAEGVRVTQATVSRDIRELGLQKRDDDLGRPRYVAPHRERRADPRETLATLLAQFGRRAVPAQNVVVVQSEIGSAPAIARALDRIGHADIVGTIAGDDTCLVVAPDAGRAAALADELERAIG